MKKIFMLTLIGVFGFILGSCGDSSPQGVSNEVFEIGSHGLEIVDQYLNNDLSRSAAVNQLDSLLSQMADVIDDLFDEYSTEDNDEDVEWALIVVTDAIDDGLANSNEEEMQARRDTLAELLGKD